MNIFTSLRRLVGAKNKNGRSTNHEAEICAMSALARRDGWTRLVAIHLTVTGSGRAWVLAVGDPDLPYGGMICTEEMFASEAEANKWIADHHAMVGEWTREGNRMRTIASRLTEYYYEVDQKAEH